MHLIRFQYRADHDDDAIFISGRSKSKSTTTNIKVLGSGPKQPTEIRLLLSNSSVHHLSLSLSSPSLSSSSFGLLPFMASLKIIRSAWKYTITVHCKDLHSWAGLFNFLYKTHVRLYMRLAYLEWRFIQIT